MTNETSTGNQTDESGSQRLAQVLVDMPKVGLPPILANLVQAAKDQIEGSLSNDEESSDEELVAFWVEECGIAQEVAAAAIQFRSLYLENPLFSMFDPLLPKVLGKA